MSDEYPTFDDYEQEAEDQLRAAMTHQSTSSALLELAERPVSRSIVEEVVGLLWAILATLSSIKIVCIIAWFMAGISMSAAVYYAIAALRSRATGAEE